jgi:hypothetical protein
MKEIDAFRRKQPYEESPETAAGRERMFWLVFNDAFLAMTNRSASLPLFARVWNSREK